MKPRIPKTGYLGPFKIQGVPLFIHWTFPVGGIFIALFLGNITWITALPLIACYTLLILAHECGHAYAAKLNSIKVHGLILTAIGGYCFTDQPQTFKAGLIFYAGGVIAQLIIFTAALLCLSVFGNPKNIVLSCMALVFTIVNLVILICNLLPIGNSDGKKIWLLVKQYMVRNRS